VASVSGASLGAAAARAARVIFEHQAPSGAIHRPLSGRPIETAFTLHLLRDLAGHGSERRLLRRYCERFLAAPDPAAARRPFGALNQAVAIAVVSAALGRPEHAAAATTMRQLWRGFDHPSGRRKAALWRVLLAELAPELRGQEALEAAEARSTTHQEWVRRIMRAAEVLDGLARGVLSPGPALIEELSADQLADGSWQRHGLLTITTLMALQKAGERQGAFARGIAYLLRLMRPDGGIPFLPDLDVWVTALTGRILAGRGEPSFDLRPLGRYLAGCELASGGWSFTAGVGPSDVDDTGLVLDFLGRLDPRGYAEVIRRSCESVISARNADGGFPTYVRGAPSEAEVTARGLMVLARDRDRHRQEIAAAQRWLAGAQRADGTFGIEWTNVAYYPIAQILLAQTYLPRAERDHAMIGRCVASVRAHQNPDGGWGAAPGGASESLPTSYALVALAHAGEPPGDALARGADFLLAAQREDGSFSSPADAVGPRPLVYEMDLFPTVYGLWGLLAARDALAARRP
jgi:hypothetical protein